MRSFPDRFHKKMLGNWLKGGLVGTCLGNCVFGDVSDERIPSYLGLMTAAFIPFNT
ncbi:leucyl/phenylalanyl-tRNA-protein transferase [Desmospora sp. 8437]|nr:leucyl/phenylalanyl-tRNA-protein transferase [Desmospora sp. 8437]